MSTFLPVPERVIFPEEEEKTLKYWKEIDAFQTSLKMSEGRKPFVFYDGPPFATGLPHYGHILAGTIKDVVTRYAHQTGHHVDRRFGWDCHGLPIEYEIDKQRKIKSRKDVEQWGLGNYNEACRGIVQRFSSEWREIITRFGRWIDFDRDYKTMDPSFMESVWWVFSQLFAKGLVYRAFKVMPYSTALATPLSNFEVNQCTADLADPSIIVAFQLKNAKALVWTTTPWTLPSNVALAVNPELLYVFVEVGDDTFVAGKDRFEWLSGKLKWKTPRVTSEVLGKDLVGHSYEPLFPYFKDFARKGKAFHVVSAEYVTNTDGTCIVHQAPAFGEEDFNTCVAAGIIDKDGSCMPCPIDPNGCFTFEVADFEGQHVKDADKAIKEVLKSRGVLLLNETEVHSVKICPRSDTPLIYKAVASWFIKVDGFNDRLVQNNEQIQWVPGHVKEGRFKNWLADAKDWLVSRNRFWGTPLPLWADDDFSEVRCIGSIAELESLTGQKLSDIHRHFIDHLEIPSAKKPGTMLKRVEEVFDCWFESGSMPYGQVHYPFENKEQFEASFPANFIAEGLDQTRGWFYTLHVLSTHIFDKPAFENVIVNGLVLAADGKKMSKRLKNYPDPMDVCHKHGADAVRLYMCNSPVVRAEPLKFKEDGVRDVVKDVFRPLYNSYRFLVQEVTRFENHRTFIPNKEKIRSSKNVTDQWIYGAAQSLIAFVRGELEGYRLYSVAGRLVSFLEDLTNWYIKMNRERMRSLSSDIEALDEAEIALNTLYDVLLDLTILLAPLTPFISELLYQNLSRALPDSDARKAASVHFVMIPQADVAALAPAIQRQVVCMQTVVELGRQLRERRKVGLKTPVKAIKISSADPQVLDDVKRLEMYILEELNAMNLEISSDVSGVELSVQPNWKALGEKLGAAVKTLPAALKSLTPAQLLEISEGGDFDFAGTRLTCADLQVTRKLKPSKNSNVEEAVYRESIVSIDFTFDPELKALAILREFKSKVQKLRKAAGVSQVDAVTAWFAFGPGNLKSIFNERREELAKSVARPVADAAERLGHEVILSRESFELEGEVIEVILTSESLRPLHLEGDAKEELELYIKGFAARSGKQLPPITIGGKEYVLKENEHYKRL